MYRLTGDSCPDGPCPRIARNQARRTVALQGYEPAENLDAVMRHLPTGETRIEMPTAVFLDLLAEHLTDAEFDEIAVRRPRPQVAV